MTPDKIEQAPEVKRFDPVSRGWDRSKSYGEMENDPLGDYVSYEDYAAAVARAEKAEARVEDLSIACDFAEIACDFADAATANLRSELKQAREDSARLDWLGDESATIDRIDRVQCHWPGVPLREAIDLAMLEARVDARAADTAAKEGK
jgi:hypothetical protein